MRESSKLNLETQFELNANMGAAFSGTLYCNFYIDFIIILMFFFTVTPVYYITLIHSYEDHFQALLK